MIGVPWCSSRSEAHIDVTSPRSVSTVSSAAGQPRSGRESRASVTVETPFQA